MHLLDELVPVSSKADDGSHDFGGINRHGLQSGPARGSGKVGRASCGPPPLVLIRWVCSSVDKRTCTRKAGAFCWSGASWQGFVPCVGSLAWGAGAAPWRQEHPENGERGPAGAVAQQGGGRPASMLAVLPSRGPCVGLLVCDAAGGIHSVPGHFLLFAGSQCSCCMHGFLGRGRPVIGWRLPFGMGLLGCLR